MLPGLTPSRSGVFLGPRFSMVKFSWTWDPFRNTATMIRIAVALNQLLCAFKREPGTDIAPTLASAALTRCINREIEEDILPPPRASSASVTGQCNPRLPVVSVSVCLNSSTKTISYRQRSSGDRRSMGEGWGHRAIISYCTPAPFRSRVPQSVINTLGMCCDRNQRGQAHLYL